jgi:hypothetical protein
MLSSIRFKSADFNLYGETSSGSGASQTQQPRSIGQAIQRSAGLISQLKSTPTQDINLKQLTDIVRRQQEILYWQNVALERVANDTHVSRNVIYV